MNSDNMSLFGGIIFGAIVGWIAFKMRICMVDEMVEILDTAFMRGMQVRITKVLPGELWTAAAGGLIGGFFGKVLSLGRSDF